MRILAAAMGIGAALGGQALLARASPALGPWVDLMLLPVAWYALRGEGRWAMGVGCAGGLLADAWFRVEALGLGGFKKTLLGWMVAAVALRLDLNHVAGRFVAGAALALGDQILEWSLRALLDLAQGPWRPGAWLGRTVIGGVLVAGLLPVVERGLKRWGGGSAPL